MTMAGKTLPGLLAGSRCVGSRGEERLVALLHPYTAHAYGVPRLSPGRNCQWEAIRRRLRRPKRAARSPAHGRMHPGCINAGGWRVPEGVPYITGGIDDDGGRDEDWASWARMARSCAMC
ncbi:hypothetical protein BC628DRAFT_1338829 [Trametes gibbosa]|nr:hypothetical protein BC628DRAFT_1338829 [Trametes gibbosa]